MTQKLSTIARLAVVGAGQMGTGIAIVAASKANIERVTLIDNSAEQLSKSQAFIEKWAEKEVGKNRLTQIAAENLKKSIKMSHLDSDAVKEVQFVVEAVKECIDVKRELFQKLDEYTPKHAILASNTSSISITKIAACTNRPDLVIGMHFMNPVPVMPLVELIKGLATDEDTLNTTLSLAERMGKTVGVSLDRPGFISNRILMPYINEAAFCLQEQIATVEDIDKIIKLGTNGWSNAMRLTG
eukprot:GHVL01032305.1.p1 GENE.GHVL01032305.1~~GHVL01032305.1.p1  ORF type:complete len:242 (-),score=40.58 GHVL01032305.1:481-1206(-)